MSILVFTLFCFSITILSKHFKGYSSGQSHFSEINVKLAEKNEFANRSVQRCLEMCENKQKPSVSKDFRQKKFY